MIGTSRRPPPAPLAPSTRPAPSATQRGPPRSSPDHGTVTGARPRDPALSGASGCRPSPGSWTAEPLDHPQVVAAGPVLDEHAVGDPPDVDEVPRCGLVCDREIGQQRHRGAAVGAVQGDVLDGEVSLGDEVMLLGAGRAEVSLDRLEDLPQSLAALGAGGVVDHVGCHKFVQNSEVCSLLASEQLLHDGSGAEGARLGCRLYAVTRQVGAGHAVGRSAWPLDELDAVAVRIGGPRRPEVVGAVGRFGLVRLDSARSQLFHGRMQVLDLDDEWLRPQGCVWLAVGSWTSSSVTNSSSGSFSIVKVPSSVAGTAPSTW